MARKIDVDLKKAEANGYDSQAKIWRSTRRPLSLPVDETVDIVEWFCQSNPNETMGDKLAMVDASTDEKVTYRQLKLRVQTLAAGLSSVLNVKKGDVVLMLSPNSVWYPVVCLGVIAVGAIVTTVNPIYTPQEILHQVKDSGAKAIITTNALHPKVKSSGLPTVLISDEGTSLPHNTIPFSKLMAADPLNAPKVTRLQSDVAALLYSSGTTGLSKGVVLTHKSLMCAAQQLIFDGPPDTRERRYVITLPMFHVYGLAVVTIAQLQRGATLVILPRFEAGLLLRSLEKYKVTDVPLVPPMILLLAKGNQVEKYDLSSVVEVTSGAAPLGKDLMQSLKSRFPSWSIRQGFGMTETSGAVSVTKCQPNDSHFGSCGEIISNMEAKIVEVQTGRSMAPYEHGEICVRGPNLMTGYLNNDEATAATIDAEGWLRTGDLGYFDDIGQLWVVDRLKELIKYKGYQVAPAELEALILTHPDILDVAVVPIPDPVAGELPVAYVVRSPESKVTEKTIITFVARQVAPYKRIRRVTFIDTIPKSLSGKILRRELAQKARSKL